MFPLVVDLLQRYHSCFRQRSSATCQQARLLITKSKLESFAAATVAFVGAAADSTARCDPSTSTLPVLACSRCRYLQAGQNVLIQSGPEDDEADALLAIASQAGVPKHMNLGLVQMKDQERVDRCPALPCPALPCPALPCPALSLPPSPLQSCY